MVSKYDSLIQILRDEERQKLINEGYILKSECPKARNDEKIRQLKKTRDSLQRKVTELILELETIKMMR